MDFVKQILIEVNEIVLQGILNETKAAQEFEKRLPISISCRKNEVEYYSYMPRGVFDPYNIQFGFHKGDMILWDGIFRLPYMDADVKQDREKSMVIGHVRDVSILRDLPSNIKITINFKED